MASIAVCQKPVKYLNIRTQQPSSLSQNTVAASIALSDSSYGTDDSDDSDDSASTPPTTPGSETPWPGRTNKIYKREERKPIDVQEPPDPGTFDDWLRWDLPVDSHSDMNNLRTQDPEELVVFIEDPVSFSPLFQSRQLSATDTPQREALYSPAPPWPSPGIRSFQQQHQTQVPFLNTVLTPQEERRLRDIAMPPGKGPNPSSFTMTNPTAMPFAAQPDATSVLPHTQSPMLSIDTKVPLNRQRKRKTKLGSSNPDNQLEADSEGSEESSATPSKSTPVAGKGKKSSHNMIEKRYRNNLNDKITELRDSVPSLRVMSKSLEDEEDEMGFDEDLQGLTPAHKLNKATILSKAAEYIAHLEKRNAYLIRENADLKSRVDAFEILVTSRPQPQQQQQQQQGGVTYQSHQRQDYLRGYEDGQRAYRQVGGNALGLGQSPGWLPRG